MTFGNTQRAWTRTGPVLALFIAVLFAAAPALPYGGGGDVGGHSTSGSMTSPMDAQIIGYFFGVPIRTAPVEQTGRPPRDIPVLSAMSEESRQELMWENLRNSIRRSQEAGYRVIGWTVLLNGAYAIEFAGAVSRFTLNFVPGVGWTTNAGLSALNSGVESYQQGGDTGDIALDAAVGGTVSALTNRFGPGRNAQISYNNARGLQNIGFSTANPARSIRAMDGALSNYFSGLAQSGANVVTEEVANRTIDHLRDQRRRIRVNPTQQAWQSTDMYGRDLKE